MHDSIGCFLTLHQVTENRYVKYPMHNSWRYESIVLTNTIAGKPVNIKKLNYSELISICKIHCGLQIQGNRLKSNMCTTFADIFHAP